MLDCLPKSRHHIFPHLLDEFTRECTLVRDDSVTFQGLNVGIYAAEKSVFSTSVRCHAIFGCVRSDKRLLASISGT
jgi:hypothetical protein